MSLTTRKDSLTTSEVLKKRKPVIPQLRGTVGQKYRHRFALCGLAFGGVFGVICHFYCSYFTPDTGPPKERIFRYKTTFPTNWERDKYEVEPPPIGNEYFGG